MPLRVVALLVVTAMLSCGDGGTEPAPDPPRPTTVTVTPANSVLSALGATVQLTAEVHDQYGGVLSGAAVSWSSNAPSVAAVDATGLTTANRNGIATVTAATGSVSGNGTVTVAQQTAAVTVSPDTATLVQGDTLRLTARATDANGHPVSGAEFAWSSTDTEVVEVDDEGLVTAAGFGEGTITATSSAVTGAAEFTVMAPAPTTVAVAPAMVDFTALGQTMLLSAEVFDQLGRTMKGVGVTWASADTMVAVVDSVGLATAAGPGETDILATVDSISGEARVSVRQTVASVAVVSPADTIAPGDTLRLTARATDMNGHLLDDQRVTWSSRDTSVARVDNSGLVIGVDEGVATIVATALGTVGTARIGVVSPDRAVLLALYEAMGGPRWTDNDNWATEAPIRTWSGIGINDRGRVQAFNLPANNMSGPIPPEISGLTDLERLNLSGDNLTGSIPPDIWTLTSLEFLALGGNNLTGSIPPDIRALTNLEFLSLSFNNLTGSIPPDIRALTNLEFLSLSFNNLTGSIPPELGQLLNLRVLDTQGNDLTGPIPPQLGSLANLRSLIMGVEFAPLGGAARGGLTGPIPPELGRLTNLSRLDLRHNRLTGPIPPELGRLNELERLSLGNNSLTGPIPPELGDLANLRTLYLSGNRLTGPIPPELGKLTKLEGLYTQFTSVTTIPPELGLYDPMPSKVVRR